MGNIVRLHEQHTAPDEVLNMNNVGTAVFISVLTLAGSALAQTQRDKEFVIWLAEHDQAVIGLGTVGFDISEMPWTQTNFEAEKHFLIRVIEAAQAKTGWNLLDYQPGGKLLSHLATFHHLVSQVTLGYVDPAHYHRWLDVAPEYAVPAGYPRCPQHQVLLHWHGCVICNDR